MEFLLFFLFAILVIIIVVSLSSGNRKDNHANPHTKFTEETEVPLTVTVTFGKGHDDEAFVEEPGADPEELWIPAGQATTVCGYEIPGGMIYVGQNLASLYGIIDLAMINPKLKIDRSNPDYVGSSLSYWPSYSAISPEARAAYLEWLSKGRRTAGTNIGYVFLFFYGLERRLLVDAKNSDKARSEAPQIINEAEELLITYGENNSFASYARNLLDYTKIVFLPDSFKHDLTRLGESWEFPLELKLTLAEYAETGRPLPPELALAWAEHDPQKYFRTPAQRCREEFIKLFEIRFGEKFGDGVVVKPGKAKIQIGYRPASGGLAGESIFHRLERPDITGQAGPLRKIQHIADSCAEELDSYSRFLGRRPEEAKTLAALSLLPKEILASTKTEAIQSLKNFLETSLGLETKHRIIKAEGLLGFFGLQGKEKLAKSDGVIIAQLLGKLNYGIVPDIRFDEGRIEPAEPMLIFKLATEQQTVASKYYSVAVMLMNLAIAVSTSDDALGEQEKLLLESHLEKMLQLSDHERERLRAYLEWSYSAKPELSGMKRRLTELHKAQRETIAEFLLRIANADGVIHPEEVKALKKIYGLLALDDEQIYSDIHRVQTSLNGELTLIVPQGVQKKGYPVPKKDIAEKSVVLDEKAIERTLKDTATVQVILADVFVDEDIPSKEPIKAEGGILGLDTSHSELLKMLLDKPKWSRGEFESLCEKYNVLPAGAIETINENSFQKFNDALIEDGEEIGINIGLSKEVRN